MAVFLLDYLKEFDRINGVILTRSKKWRANQS